MTIELIKLADIKIDGGTQSRVAIDEQTIADYAEALTDGADFPPITVFLDGTSYQLADGFHRLLANRRIGAVTIKCEVKHGTLIDAQLYSCGANQAHGRRRTNDDKRKAVEMALSLKPDWSDRAIAKHVGVSITLVSAMRRPAVAEKRDAARSKDHTNERGVAGLHPSKRVGYSEAPQIQPVAPQRQEPVPANAPVLERDDYDDLASANQELLAENDELTKRLAVIAMDATPDEKRAAADMISELRAQVVSLERDLRAVKSSRDSYMIENGELKKQVAYWRKQAEKAAAA